MNQDRSYESFFVVVCPGCRSRVSVALSNLSKNVSCRRCRSKFLAEDPQARSAAECDPMQYWVEFTDRGECDDNLAPDSKDLFRVPR